MKRTALLLTMASALAGTFAVAQTTAPKPTTPAAKAAAKPAVTAKSGTPTKTVAPVGGVKVPPGIPVYHRLVKTAFALKFQDISIGTGELAEPLKLYEVKYTGWLAADGKKFDSSEDHPGKEPIKFPQGRGRVIPGWDQAFDGMRIGGKRRIFIPYQLAYGAAGRPPVIPAKSDLIFDIELVSVSDMPTPGAMGPGMGGRPMPQRPTAPGTPAPPATPSTPGTSAPAPKPADPAATPAPATPSTPTTPSAPSTPPPTPPADKPATPQQ